MIESAIVVAVVLVPVVITAALCWIAIRRTVTEPRRLSNAYWLLIAVLALLNLIAVVVPGGSTIFAVAAVIMIIAPLLIIVLAIFLILNGVELIRRERPSPAHLLSLLAGLGMLVLAVLAIPVLVRRNALLIIGYGAVVLAVGYLGFQFFAFVGYSFLYRRLVRNRPAQWVVVLGSGLGVGGRVTPLLAARIRTGLEEFGRREARTLIMSGGQGEDEPISEAAAMAAWAIENGADRATLALEDRSRNTEQNLRYSAALVPRALEAGAPGGGAPGGGAPAGAPGDGAPGVGTSGDDVGEGRPVESDARPQNDRRGAGVSMADQLPPGLIVTSNYHAMRAAILARKVGLPAQAVGAPTAGYYWPSAMIREFIAILAERPVLHLIWLLIVAVPLPALVAFAQLP